uniref:Nucleolar 27S pre-rRNA processing Urb2/Npa2 C-terminal domain-containing protein n=1 Tax=Periophthalmus magnuspinnatus TaxID=409849 RepID=A0A3B3ZCZ4_9GOBI
MAAIYSGIYLKLKSAQTPWEDKIKLARFAWISSQCLLPNKEQVLLDWCTHALTGWYKKKVDFPQNVLDGLWCYLDDLLHSRKLHSFLKQGKSISLRLNMAQFLIKSSSQDVSLNLPFTIPVMATVTALLRQGEGVIANPHHVTMVLGALQWVPLDHLAPAVYEATFTAIHETLFAIIKCHPQVMLKAAPSFLNVFYRLVASIMQEGKQRKDTDAVFLDGISLRCSMLVERMCSHIAATSEDFTTLSAFIVAQYVTELQKVTLRPDVKMHLTEGIYMILDLCLEQDIKFLMAGLQTGVREVFNELYSSYTHYHKTQRQGEEKYTV